MFPEDIVRVFLGSKWLEAAPIFRLLAPTMFVFALINPFAWMLMATGRISRSVNMAFVIAPTVVAGYAIGLPSGAHGVAFGFSGAMLLLAGPMVVWAVRGTPIPLQGVVKAVWPSLLSITIGAGVALTTSQYLQSVQLPIVRLVIETGIFFGTYALVLLFALNQRASYVKVFRELRFWRVQVETPAAVA